MSEDFDPIDHSIKLSRKYPFDVEGLAGTHEDVETMIPEGDWSVNAARAVITDLCGRRGIKHGFRGIQLDVKMEIVQTLSDIIKRCYGESPPQGFPKEDE